MIWQYQLQQQRVQNGMAAGTKKKDMDIMKTLDEHKYHSRIEDRKVL